LLFSQIKKLNYLFIIIVFYNLLFITALKVRGYLIFYIMRGLNLTIGFINYLFFLKYTLNQVFLIISLILEKKYFFYLSSILDDFLLDISNSFIKKSSFELEDNILYLKSVEVIKLPNFNQKENIIYLLSPITVYSTIGNKTYFYSPNENKFYELIKQNLLKKYKAYYKDYNVDNFDFDIQLLKFDNKRDKKVIFYKNNCIISYEGMYKISGSEEILKFAWNTGLGSKNSQGFGMFEVKG
jgi:CRISPR-associated endoribonuclease Cas6